MTAWKSVYKLIPVILICQVSVVCQFVQAKTPDNDLQFIVIGDWGQQGSPEQRRVAKQMDLLAAATTVDFIVSTGDNFYPKGVNRKDDPQWFVTYESVYSLPHIKNIPWYVVLGNHDYLGNILAELDYSREHPNWILKNNYYSQDFNFGAGVTARLLFLDTSPFIEEYRARPNSYHLIETQDPRRQLAWLRGKLHADKMTWTLVFGHHPVYTSGMHGNTPELEAILPELFEQQGVDAYFAGHDHHLEHYKASGMTHYFISGSGARPRPVNKGVNHGFSISSLGFAYVIIDRLHLQVRFIDDAGKELYRTTVTSTSKAD